MNNVLVVVAHHDDLELGCGGTVAKLVDDGHQVISLVMTHSGYEGMDGVVIRERSWAIKEGILASSILGYSLIKGPGEDTFDIPASNKNILEILKAISKYKIDTILTHWRGDTHLAHRRVNDMVLAASRNVPRVLGFASNWYVGERQFAPNFFVSINDSQMERKIRALKCYKSEFERAGQKWVDYFSRLILNYGVLAGTKLAEGYVVYKYLLD
jgi:LmbE family N-acetylglucosaminyl deacetylase